MYYFSSTNTTFPLQDFLGKNCSKSLKISQNIRHGNYSNLKVVFLKGRKILLKFFKISQNLKSRKISQSFSKKLKPSDIRLKNTNAFPEEILWEPVWHMRAVLKFVKFPPRLICHICHLCGTMPSASKRQKMQQQQMMMNPLMMMLPQMAQLASMQQPAEESSSDEKEVGDKKEQVSEKSAEERRALPERGSGWRVRCPGQDDFFFSDIYASIVWCRLSEGIEWICPEMDPSMTHALSNAGLLVLVFMCTRLPPTTRINDLRAMVWVLWVWSNHISA